MPKRSLERDNVQKQVLVWLTDGLPVGEVVALVQRDFDLRVTPRAMRKFKERHGIEIAQRINVRREELRLALETDARVIWISDKQRRIYELQGLFERCMRVVHARAARAHNLVAVGDPADELPMHSGLMVEQVKWIGAGPYGEKIELEAFDAALVKELRACLADVAQELGERRPEGSDALAAMFTQLNVFLPAPGEPPIAVDG